MKRYILAMAFIIMCAVTCPLTVAAWDYDPDIQEQMDADNINITVNGMTLNVAGASRFAYRQKSGISKDRKPIATC